MVVASVVGVVLVVVWTATVVVTASDVVVVAGLPHEDAAHRTPISQNDQQRQDAPCDAPFSASHNPTPLSSHLAVPPSYRGTISAETTVIACGSNSLRCFPRTARLSDVD